MTVQLSAPHPFNQTTTILPNPDWNDSFNLKDEIITKHACDGTMYTYVKSQGVRRRLLMTFQMSFHKALELQAFLRAYYRSRIYIRDWLDAEWVGYAVGNPFEFTTDARGMPGGGGEIANFQLEFEAVPLGHEGDL